jgi:hypothetical protein
MTTMAEAGGKVLKLPGEWDRVPVRGSRRVVPATAGWDVLSQIRYAAAVYSPRRAVTSTATLEVLCFESRKIEAMVLIQVLRKFYRRITCRRIVW